MLSPVASPSLSIPPPPPRKTVATRVLASFAVTVIAFAITVGWSAFAQDRAVHDNEELSEGFLPVARSLAQLRATQATMATLVDGIPDQRNPLSTQLLLETLAGVRHAKFVETRSKMMQGLRERGSDGTKLTALALTGELDVIEVALAEDKMSFERLAAAVDTADTEGVNRLLIPLGAVEHDGDKKIIMLSDRVGNAMTELSERAHTRERRSLFALVALAVLTLGVGVAVSLHTRRLLAPLARVTERAQAVARGDLTPREVVPTDDEIGALAVAFERMVGAVGVAQSRAVSNERLAAIGKMAAHVTHEIRNPLSSIGLNIELLEEELAIANVPGESRALLQAITREVERLEHLSEEYLRVARLPQPRMEAEDIAAAVREITSFVRPEMERAGCQVALHFAEPLPAALFDEAQIRQALLNLLRNAREAMADGGLIDLSVTAEGMSVIVSVEDRGGGIPDEIRARVFDPFFSTKGEGTGLGLAITRQIVEAHGGALTCDSREGGGTSFRLALPIAPARAFAPRSAENGGMRPSSRPARARPAKQGA